MAKGVVKGEVVFIEKDEDFIPKELRGLGHDAFDEKKKMLLLNTPRVTSRVGDKIVVITGKLSDSATLEKKGIDWDDLQYARAIFIDGKIKDWEKWDIMNAKYGITPKRVKGIAPSGVSKKLDGKKATVDYATGNVYEGELKTELTRPVMRTFDWVKEAPKVPEVDALCESANFAFKDLGLHPLIFEAYKKGNLNAYEKAFFDHCNLLFEEA